MVKPPLLSRGFTLIELLAVMLIIAILLGLVLAALSGVMRTAARDRARTEIQTVASALESYKSDNGAYPTPPTGTGFSTTNDYVTASPILAGGLYQGSSAFLYEQLSGYTNAAYTFSASTMPLGHIYYPFKHAQLGNDKPAAGGAVYIKDPFGGSYGYFNGSGVNPPFNGTNQFDVWSTAADKSNPPTNLPSWITDWSN